MPIKNHTTIIPANRSIAPIQEALSPAVYRPTFLQPFFCNILVCYIKDYSVLNLHATYRVEVCSL